MKVFKILTVVFVLIASNNAKAQRTIIKNEIGVLLGPVFMQTDFGESKDFKSSTINSGLEFGLVYKADFSNSINNTWLVNHIKPRFELSFSNVNLEHAGARIDEGSVALQTQIKGMKGEVKLINLGLYTEYSFISLGNKKTNIKPYFLGGISYTSAKSSINFNDGIPAVYIPIEDNLSTTDKNNAFSFASGLGLIYNLNDIDLVIESKFQTFFSDEIDGLEPSLSGNKNNDSQVVFKIGAIFQL